MLAVHARYRGRSVRRAELVQRSASALSTLNGVGEFHVLGVEDICAVVDSATAVCDVVMALLADGDWAIGIGISPGNQEDEEGARQVATAALKKSARMGQVYAKINKRGRASEASDIAATFARSDTYSTSARSRGARLLLWYARDLTKMKRPKS